MSLLMDSSKKTYKTASINIMTKYDMIFAYREAESDRRIKTNENKSSIYRFLVDKSQENRNKRMVTRTTMKELIDVVGIRKQNVSRHLNTLVKEGLILIQKTPRNDKETYLIKIIPATELKQSRAVSEVIETFNRICKSYPRLLRVTTQRADGIVRLLEEYSYVDFLKVFHKCEESSFLKSQALTKGKVFDWIIIEDNFLRILEGGYDFAVGDKEFLRNHPNASFKRKRGRTGKGQGEEKESPQTMTTEEFIKGVKEGKI